MLCQLAIYIYGQTIDFSYLDFSYLHSNHAFYSLLFLCDCLLSAHCGVLTLPMVSGAPCLVQRTGRGASCKEGGSVRGVCSTSQRGGPDSDGEQH